MSTARKLSISDPNATKARLTPGRQWIGIKNLEAPDELQPRAGIDKDWVSQLEGFRRDGSEFPPARVYQLADGRLMLAEGHHRRWALLGAGEADILCEVVDGSMEDAIEHAAGSNKSNGVKPMGPKDVTRALHMLFATEKWWHRSNFIVAVQVGCSHSKAQHERLVYQEKHGRLIPDTVEAKNGRTRRTTQWNPKKNGYPPIHWGGTSYVCLVNRKRYFAATESELKQKVDEAINSARSKSKSLQYRVLVRTLSRYGFRPPFVRDSAFKALNCIYGQGFLVTSCDFQTQCPKEAVGALKCACNIIGRMAISKSKERLATRLILLAFREHGPARLLEAIEDCGIEIMTPDELIRSLGANGMTPDEVQASLKEKTS